LSSCGGRTAEKKKTPIVKTDTVALYGNTKGASYPGRVKSSKEASLAFKVSGNISRLPSREVSFVRKEQMEAKFRHHQDQIADTRFYAHTAATSRKGSTARERRSAPECR
jgi:multidrug efflux pump subunit AcrA (membrane-fusion protein)